MRDSRGAFLSRADCLAGAQFLLRLPSFLRHPISVQEARGILRRRLEQREADFLRLMKRAVYDNAGSPYRDLLRWVGCEYGDLKKLVNREGVEGTLGRLLQQGVYLTVDELKGRRPVVRGSLVVHVDPGRLLVRSSGSRDAGTWAQIDLTLMRETAVNQCLVVDARGGMGWRHAMWGVPGGAVLRQLLRFTGFGPPPVRWFSQVDPAAAALHPRYRWSARMLCWVSRLAGVPLPPPVHVPVDDPLPIVRWMAEVHRAGGTPHVHTFASSAVRLCQAARTAGVDLCGAQFTMSGEPITAARLAVVRRAGAEAVPLYGNSEAGGLVGYGCLAPDAADDLHLFHDLHAVVQPEGDAPLPGLPATALLITALRPTAPLVLLNVSLGDQAVLGRRNCGCALERLGWTGHLHTVRSFEKLTAGGMTFLDSDLIRVLEEVLPARFGGGPTDYQLVEEETRDGHPRLRLLVHPEVGPLEPTAVAEAFLTAISPGSGVERVMGLLWRDAGFLRVERRPPECTSGGKILHLHGRIRPPAALSSESES